jgi:hypothetical protein
MPPVQPLPLPPATAPQATPAAGPSLVIFGLSNILSDLVDAALANGLTVAQICIDQPEAPGPRDLPLKARLASWRALGVTPQVLPLADFRPWPGALCLLGPTTPTRAGLASRLQAAHGLRFHTLVHPTAHVSPLARLGEGVFVGANSVIGPGVTLGAHVFVNRGVTVGHDTSIGAFSRLQPGSHLGSLSQIGCGVSVGIGATLVERLVVGDGVVVGAGALLACDAPAGALVAASPARVRLPR